MVAYSDKVQNELANAQQAEIANKIIDKMQDLKLKNDDTTACRWIWELIQNAKDVANNEGFINIKINFDEGDKLLTFEHDGKLFTTQNMVYLISQVSSKDRNETKEDDTTGKFGTGFLTTHLLSEKVTIDTYLQDDCEPVKKVKVSLDRSGKTKGEVLLALEKSFSELEASKEVNITKENNSLLTCFLYQLDQKGLEVAKNGLNSLKAAIPYVLTFIEKIKSVRINDTFYIERGKKYVNNDFCIYTIHITENDIDKEFHILKYQKNKVDLAFPIIRNGENIIVEQYPEKIPKLFCDFPLIGTDDFPFPIIINSQFFHPNEPRSGIHLTDKDDNIVDTNKDLMMQAVENYKYILDRAASMNWKHVYNITCVPKVLYKDWISKEWLKENIVEESKNIIKEAEIVDIQNGERKSLFNIWIDEQEVFILSDSEKLVREHVWNLSKSLFPDFIIVQSEIHEWYSSLWSECKNLSLSRLISIIEDYRDVDTLKEKLNGVNPIVWLNSLYSSIEILGKSDEYKSAQIYPNQLGEFCNIEELCIDDGIEDVYKEILELLDSDCRNKLLDNRINLSNSISCEIYNYERLFDEILNVMPDDEQVNREALVKLTMLYEIGNNFELEHTELLRFLKTIYREEFSDSYVVKMVSNDILKNIRNYWCTQIADAVSECETIDVLLDEYDFDDEEDVKGWIKDFIEYLVKYDHKNLIERKTKPILPNQNGKFVKEESIFLDSGEIDDLFKDILQELGNDIREILLPLYIYYELPDIRVKGLKDVSQEVVNYIKDNQGNQRKLDEDISKNFQEIFLWIDQYPDKAKQYFKEIVENKHWLYNDTKIAENMKKAEKYDDLLEQFNIDNTKELEKALLYYTGKKEDIIPIEEVEITKELMIQYGIFSEEEFNKAKELNVFKENFVHVSESDETKFDYVKKILERSNRAVFNHLSKLKGYDMSNVIEVTNTIFIIKKNGKEIVLIIRPSDYGQVILYYGAEKDVLDYEKDYELWVEDGVCIPQQITFGKMLKLTGINRIPLRKV